MENRAVVLLEKIKDGSILNELAEYENLQRLDEHQRKILDYIIQRNERCRFPTNNDIKKDFNLNISDVPLERLLYKELIFGTTIPELIGVFGYYSGRRRNMPEELIHAICNKNNVGSFNFNRGRGSAKSWDNKIKSSRAPAYKRYHIALISKDQVPVFRSAFEFLDYLKTEPNGS